MDSDKEQDGNRGILTAVALIFAALLILLNEWQPFTVVFSLDMLPSVLRQKIELGADGVIITAAIIRKHDAEFTRLDDKEFSGIMLNRFMDFFGLREDWKNRKDEEEE